MIISNNVMKITLGDKVMFDSCSCCCYYWFMIPLWKCLVSSWVVLKRSEIFVSESETYYEMTRKAIIYKFILAIHIQRCFCNILFKWNKDNQNNIFFCRHAVLSFSFLNSKWSCPFTYFSTLRCSPIITPGIFTKLFNNTG